MNPVRTAAWAGMFIFGTAVTLLGAILPLLVTRARFDLAQAGLLFMLLNAAVVFCSLTAGGLVDRGPWPVLSAGAFLVALALLGVMAARGFPLLVCAALLLGLGGGALNVATNTVAATLARADGRKDAELNTLGIFFGLGSLLVPASLGALLETGGLDLVLGLAAALCAAASVAFLLLRYPSLPATPQAALRPSRTRLQSPWVGAASLLLFFQAGNEMIVSGYSTTHLARLGSVTQASWAFSGMWIAVLLTRAGLARFARHLEPYRTVQASAAFTIAGTLWLLAAGGMAPAACALLLTGAGMAGIFPTTMGLAAMRFPSRTGGLFGPILAVARSGAMLMPLLAGYLAGQWGSTGAMALACLLALGILLLSLALTRLK